jgi:hypothetical protein
MALIVGRENMTPDKNEHYWNDDGTEFNPNLVPKPSLCVNCAKDELESEHILCNLTRADQQDEQEFRCFAYRPKGSVPDDDADDKPILF